MNEKVTVFGEDISKHNRADDQGVIWGLLLIFGGILLLLNTLGIVPWSVWDQIWRFWPVFLVIWGMQILLGTGIIGRVVMTLFLILLLTVVVLFALADANPQLQKSLPDALNPVFSILGGVMI